MQEEKLLIEEKMDDSIEVRKQRYLLQIHRIKLQNYVQQALVAPDSYLDKEREIDIQSKNPNYLLLSDGYIDKIDEYNVLIELILTQQEKESLIQEGEVFYLDKPLPITRIKKVYVQNNEIRDHILKQLASSERGFLPKRLFDVYQKRNKNIFDKFSYSTISASIETRDYRKSVMTFDKRMGMFAFMKNSNIYYADSTGYISNYSKYFFSVLTWFSKDEAKESIDFLKVLERPDRYLKDMLKSDKQIDEEFIQNIGKEIEDISLKEYFLGVLKPNNARRTIKKLVAYREKKYFFVALLYYFRDRNSNRKDNFKSGIEELIPYEYSEEALAILGIFLGYERLRAVENYELKDKYFNKIFKSNSFNLKFTLENRLDYVLIERVYQYCFNNQKNNDFEYLKYPTKRYSFQLPKDNYFQLWYDAKSEIKFNTEYIQIDRKTFEGIFQRRIKNYHNDIILGKDYLFSYIAKYHEHLIKIPKYGDKFVLYASRDKFAEIGITELNQNRQNELIRVFKMDKK